MLLFPGMDVPTASAVLDIAYGGACSGGDAAAVLRDAKRAYRRLALRYHPDKNAGSNQARLMFLKIGLAYKTVVDSLRGDPEEAGLGHYVDEDDIEVRAPPPPPPLGTGRRPNPSASQPTGVRKRATSRPRRPPAAGSRALDPFNEMNARVLTSALRAPVFLRQFFRSNHIPTIDEVLKMALDGASTAEVEEIMRLRGGHRPPPGFGCFPYPNFSEGVEVRLRAHVAPSPEGRRVGVRCPHSRPCTRSPSRADGYSKHRSSRSRTTRSTGRRWPPRSSFCRRTTTIEFRPFGLHICRQQIETIH